MRPPCRSDYTPQVAHNLGNLWWRLLVEDRELVADHLAAAAGEDRGRLVEHARYYWPMPAENHLTRRLFGSMVADRCLGAGDGVAEER